MDILRFTTAGNVDDGKSTLIGRLLYDTHNIKSDILESVSESDDDRDGTVPETSGDKAGHVNLAFLTDGLRAERAQGITIDVAYKYFVTQARKYIITDAPGHFQYTRNLVTGASGVDAMIILIDAKNGITEQTRRHLLVASFLGIRQLVVAINKMDLLDYAEQVFTQIKSDFIPIAKKLGIHHPTFIPISALHGDNIFAASSEMQWYTGATLMDYLEACKPVIPQGAETRFAVQCIIESNVEGHKKGFAGKILSGHIRQGDLIGVYPGSRLSAVTHILHGYDPVSEALPGQNVTVYLQDEINAGRGSLFAHPSSAPYCCTTVEATLCWLDSTKPLMLNHAYILRINGAEAPCRVAGINYKIDVHSYDHVANELPLSVNQFAKVTIQTENLFAFDSFSSIPANGRGIIIDADTYYTAGAFVINIE